MTPLTMVPDSRDLNVPVRPAVTSAPSLRGSLQGRPLSPREYECLRLYAWLGRWQDVAGALGIGTQTVKNHVHAAYRKLDVGFATQAYTALGWLNAPGPRP